MLLDTNAWSLDVLPIQRVFDPLHLLIVLIGVIAKFGTKWLLDPQPSTTHLWDMLWLYARNQLVGLCGTLGDGSDQSHDGSIAESSIISIHCKIWQNLTRV